MKWRLVNRLAGGPAEAMHLRLASAKGVMILLSDLYKSDSTQDVCVIPERLSAEYCRCGDFASLWGYGGMIALRREMRDKATECGKGSPGE